MAPRKVAEKLVEKVHMRLDGKDWPLVINNLVLIDVEDLTGFNLLNDLQIHLAKPSQKFVTAILYAAMKRAGAPYSFEEVATMVGFHNMGVATEAVTAAIIASMPQTDEEDAGPTKAVD